MFSRSIAAACCLASFLLLALHEPTATGSGSLATPCGHVSSATRSIRYVAVDWKERALEASRSSAVVRRLNVSRWAPQTRGCAGPGGAGQLTLQAAFGSSVSVATNDLVSAAWLAVVSNTITPPTRCTLRGDSEPPTCGQSTRSYRHAMVVAARQWPRPSREWLVRAVGDSYHGVFALEVEALPDDDLVEHQQRRLHGLAAPGGVFNDTCRQLRKSGLVHVVLRALDMLPLPPLRYKLAACRLCIARGEVIQGSLRDG
jgi:hypothetical protein